MRYVNLDQINPSNVATLVPAWILHTCVMNERTSFDSQPIVVNGIMYVSSPLDHVFALDAGTGARDQLARLAQRIETEQQKMLSKAQRTTILELDARKVTAAAALCYSRMLFFQIYPAFQRFDCKVSPARSTLGW